MRSPLASVSLVLVAALWGVGGCIDFGVAVHEDPCHGRPEVVAVLPDVTLLLGESDRRPLEDTRFPVFRHTEDRPMHYAVEVDDADVSQVTVTERVLHVVAIGIGQTRVTVEAGVEGCPETARTYFTAHVRAVD